MASSTAQLSTASEPNRCCKKLQVTARSVQFWPLKNWREAVRSSRRHNTLELVGGGTRRWQDRNGPLRHRSPARPAGCRRGSRRRWGGRCCARAGRRWAAPLPAAGWQHNKHVSDTMFQKGVKLLRAKKVNEILFSPGTKRHVGWMRNWLVLLDGRCLIINGDYAAC